MAGRPYDALIVGAGLTGCVLAERLARGAGLRVLVIDQRDHVGGNAAEGESPEGLRYHRYGPHIFHTNATAVFRYLSDFTAWRPYRHRVLARTQHKLFSFPITLATLEQFFLQPFDEATAGAFLAQQPGFGCAVENAEDAVISRMGRTLHEAFFAAYTAKQWGVPASQLLASVTNRIALRFTRDPHYFHCRHEAIPLHGYNQLFGALLDHPLIDVALGQRFEDLRNLRWSRLIYTGPIDAYFQHRLGALPYRCLRFRHVVRHQEWVQPVAVVNFTGPVPFTRRTEHKHLTGQRHTSSILTYEFPGNEGTPAYPLPSPPAQALSRRYRALAHGLSNVWFAGRLGRYQYLDMDQCVGQALMLAGRLSGTPPVKRTRREAAFPAGAAADLPP